MGEARVAVKKKKLSNNKLRKLKQMGDDAFRALHAGQFVQAESVCQEMLHINPYDSGAYHVLGEIAKSMGELNSARQLYEQGLSNSPKHAGLLSSCGYLCEQLKDYVGAEKYWRRYTQVKPNHVDGWQSLSAVLCQMLKFESAEVAAEKAIKISPRGGELYKNLGVIQVSLKKFVEAEYALRKSILLDPDSEDATYSLARLLMENGEMEEAYNLFNKLVDMSPRHAASYYMLLQFWQVSEYSCLVKSAEHLQQDENVACHDRELLSFCLGKAWADLGDYDKSFAYYIEGNRFHRKESSYNIHDDRKDTEDIKRLFSREVFTERSGLSGKGAEYLFIVGLPRSGSTLLDRIISSHPNVIDCGENDLFRQVLGYYCSDGSNRINLQLMLDASEGQLEGAANSFRENILRLFGSGTIYTDKSLQNLWLIGAIHVMLPSAKILHCTRNPLDNCLSIFTQNFAGDQFEWGYDLQELGEYYGLYQDMMSHWRSVLPEETFLELAYEDLVAAPEEQMRRVIGFCGLDWDDACLSFYKHKGNVQTLSLSQVRQPINNKSIGRWRQYESHLQPLVEALGSVAEINSNKN